jgi:hypothetical protein
MQPSPVAPLEIVQLAERPERDGKGVPHATLLFEVGSALGCCRPGVASPCRIHGRMAPLRGRTAAALQTREIDGTMISNIVGASD